MLHGNRQCQLSLMGQFWHLRSPLPQGNRLLLDVSVLYRAGVSVGARRPGLAWKKNKLEPAHWAG